MEKLRPSIPAVLELRIPIISVTSKALAGFTSRPFIDTCSKLAFAKLYDRKNALVAADMLNDKAVPFFDEHGIPLLRVLTDRGTEIAASGSITSTSSTLLWKTLITPEPRRVSLKPTEFASGSTKPF